MTDTEWKTKQIKKQTDGIISYFKTHISVWTGKKHSLETIEKMRNPKNIGETNSQYGSCWITNGIENKKIKKIDKIPENWHLGRTIENHKSLSYEEP